MDSLLLLKDQHQTGKWQKRYSRQMEEGPLKEAEATKEAEKVRVIPIQ